ncbi:MAG: hypothetical protein JST46_08050 [Bacteroidetes bacterium]|nr:hypothetical protein [Bacteroidota bacterium]
MQKLLRVPVFFFFLAGCVGLLLRWQAYRPINIDYTFWLHAHSHVMFLGWIFNALMVGMIWRFVPGEKQAGYKPFLWWINIMVTGMLISFPLQGYGLFSISISALHTLLVLAVIVRFFRDTFEKRDQLPVYAARIALVFFMIASAGPFVVGTLKANGLGQSDYYYLAVYYYLHFQYNGAFLFGVFALLLEWSSGKGINPDHTALRRSWRILFVAVFPAYVLTALWTKPGLAFNAIGFIAGLMQIVACFYLLTAMSSVPSDAWRAISRITRRLLTLAIISFVVKIVLQLLSSFPAIAQLAYENRNIVIAYLHLVLLGMFTLALMAWYHEQQIVRLRVFWTGTFVLSFIVLELVLVISGFTEITSLPVLLLVTTAGLVIGLGGWGMGMKRGGGE